MNEASSIHPSRDVVWSVRWPAAGSVALRFSPPCSTSASLAGRRGSLAPNGNYRALVASSSTAAMIFQHARTVQRDRVKNTKPRANSPSLSNASSPPFSSKIRLRPYRPQPNQNRSLARSRSFCSQSKRISSEPARSLLNSLPVQPMPWSGTDPRYEAAERPTQRPPASPQCGFAIWRRQTGPAAPTPYRRPEQHRFCTARACQRDRPQHRGAAD